MGYDSALDRILSDPSYAAGWRKGVDDLRIRLRIDAEEADHREDYRNDVGYLESRQPWRF